MFKICYADLAKAFGKKEFKRRPVVIMEDFGDSVKILKVTSRNRDDKYHVRMNNFLIYGFCDVSKFYIIKKKYLLSYVRDCTTSESEAIKNKINFQEKY